MVSGAECGCESSCTPVSVHFITIRSEKVHSSSNGPGRSRLLLKTISIEFFEPVGPKIGPTGPTVSIVIVIGPDSAEPGL